MSNDFIDLKEYVGHRVCLSFNKKGILRYCGYVSFGPGKWCGIELDEAEGNTDGKVNNITYFSCETNHGIFVKASEIISDLLLTKNDSEFITLFPDDECTEVPKRKLFKKAAEVGETGDILCEEDATSDDHYESDESLGILPLHLLEKISDDEFILDKNESCTKEAYQLHNNGINHEENVKNLSEQDMFSVWNTTNKLEISSHISPIQCMTPHKSKTLTHILQELENLNVTLTLHDRTSEVDEVKIIEEKGFVEDFSSSVCMVSKILKIPPDKPDDESSSESIPTQFASTPKSDANCTFVLDERILNSGANFSPVSHLNKTIVKRQDSMQKNLLSSTITLFSDTNENSNSEKNKYATCNTKLLDNSQHELNKTFYAISDVKCLPFVKSYDSALLNTTITFPEEYENKDQTSKIEISGSNKEENLRYQCDKMIETNVLNKTISLSEKLDNINLDKSIDSNDKVSDFFAEEKFENNIITNSALDTATPIATELKNEAIMFDSEKKYVHDKSEILNTTYEKMDMLSRLPKILKSQKQPMIKDTRHAKFSKIAGRLLDYIPSTSAYSNELPELDKKRNRKSVSIPSNSNSGIPNKNRRQTFGSFLSKTSDNVASPQSPLLQNVQKQHFISRATSAQRSLTKSSPSPDYHVHRRYSDKEKRSIESADCKKLTISSNAKDLHSLLFPVKKIRNGTFATEKQLEQDPKLFQDETTPIHLMSGAKSMVKFPEKRVLLMKNEWSNSSETSLRQNVEKSSKDECTKRPLRSRIPAPSTKNKKGTGMEKEKIKGEVQGAQKKASKTSPPQRIMM